MIKFDGKKVSFSFRNPEVKRMFINVINNENLEQKDAMKKIEEFSNQRAAEGIIAGFWLSFFACAKNVNDFTYEALSIEGLTRDLVELFTLDMKNYPLEKSRELVIKTLAALLYGFAMNEHGCTLDVSLMKTDLTDGKAILQPLWADTYSIRTGTLEKRDFLDAAVQAMEYKDPTYISRGFYLYMRPFIRAYKKAVGVDLSGYGLRDIAIVSK